MQKRVFYAVLTLCRKGKGVCETRFFTGYSAPTMHDVLTRLAEEAAGSDPAHPLQTGIWSIHGRLGTAIEAHTYSAFWGDKWRDVPGAAMRGYDLNTVGRTLAAERSDTINDDGTVTVNGERS